VALLALLVSAGGHTVPAERLVSQLWGEEAPDGSLANLQVGVAKLRRALEPERGARGDATVLVTRPNGYAVVVDEVDATRFAHLVSRADAVADSSPTDAEALLVEALAMWQGPAYGGVADLAPALATEARRLHQLRWAATERLWGVRLAQGGHAAAVPELRALVDEEPMREELWRLLALALYRSGRQAEALDALREVRERLAEELGLDPGEPLRTLEQEVLRQDPGLAAPARARPPASQATAQPGPDPELPGRDAALEQTRQLVEAALAGRGGVLLVVGEAGIGKTRFTRAVTEQAAGRGLRVGWGTWEQEEGPPLAGWRAALRDLPGGEDLVDAGGVRDPDGASTVLRLADDVVALLRAAPVCLVLDDVHWADPDSHRLLRRVVSTLGAAPSLVIVVTREVAARHDPEAALTVATVTRGDALRVDLGGLDADAVGAQVHDALGHAVEPDVAAALRARTDGNPFYVREMVRALAPTGRLDGDRIDDWGGVPAGVRDVVRHRLADLPPTVSQALSVAAVLGRAFDADVVERAWTGPEDGFDEALTMAEAAGLVEPDGPGSYRFAHALARDAVYEELAGPARAKAHARVAAALEQARVGRLEGYAVPLAEHYRLAGPAHARDAWTYGSMAAEHAAGQGLHVDAARHLAIAVEQQDADHYATDQERERLLAAHGAAMHRSGRTIEAWAPLATSARSSLARGEPATAARTLLAITQHSPWTRRQNPAWDADAIALWEEVLAALPESEPGLRSLCAAALSAELLHDPAPTERAVRIADDAMAEARRLGDPALLADVCSLATLGLSRPDLLARRVALTDEVLALRQRTRDDVGIAAALSRRSDLRVELGQWDGAVADVLRAKEIAERLHLASTLMIAELRLSVVHQAVGDWDAAVASLQAVESIQAVTSLAGNGMAAAMFALMRITTGGLGDLEPLVRANLHQHPMMRDLHAATLLDLGRDAEARTAVGPWPDQEPVSWDYMWLARTSLRAYVWSRLGDENAATDLYAQLTPFADRLAVAQFMFGSVQHVLAELAAAAGDRPAAEAHARAALARHRELGWTPWVERSQAVLSTLDAAADR